MYHKTIEIWDNCSYKPEDHELKSTLTTYVPDYSPEMAHHDKRPAVLICPGGGYQFTSDREAEPIAIRFAAAGFHAFVLRYRTSPSRHPAPLLDLSRAMWIIRENAGKWHLDPDRIAVCGFSAGGHLAGSLGVFWQQDWIREAIGMPHGMNRPNAQILSYPVITSGQHAHRGSFENLLGGDASEEMLKSMSLEHHVNKETPPTFLWHTFNDQAVPVENSLLIANALRQQGVPFELHIYPEGVHGLSLCDKETAGGYGEAAEWINPHAATWFSLCVEWLNGLWGR
ncbi:MAG: alpha/beta hydrolase [Caldicoprobacterales bacterium]|jgi:acetyl esterase/lipase|nr:alpha/beta hydrolase [Clostridiales bacterium]